MTFWKIGCSGYHYNDWKRIFYPENLAQRQWFEYYASHFNSIELNFTFYRFPKIDFLESLNARTPENFTFTVKAPRLITHFKRINEAQEALNNFYVTVKEGVKGKLGCVLFQFPSSFVYEEHRLDRLLNLVDNSFRNVVEFRHASWWRDDVFDRFRDNNMIFSGMSHPDLPDRVIKTSDVIYYRLHGVPHLYSSRYETAVLEKLSQNISELDDVKEAFITFNNTAEGAAVLNAREFREISEGVSRER